MPKPEGPRLGMYLRERKDRDGGYYHIEAGVVTIDDAGKIRNAGDDAIGGLFLKDFQITSQGNDHDTPRRLYAWEVSYDPFRVEASDARRIVKTFDAIERRMTKLETTVGRPVTFGQYVARVAHAIGATAIVWPRGERAPGWSTYDDARHHIGTLADGIEKVDAMVRAWAAPETVEA